MKRKFLNTVASPRLVESLLPPKSRLESHRLLPLKSNTALLTGTLPIPAVFLMALQG
jgi:hypothetical protein